MPIKLQNILKIVRFVIYKENRKTAAKMNTFKKTNPFFKHKLRIDPDQNLPLDKVQLIYSNHRIQVSLRVRIKMLKRILINSKKYFSKPLHKNVKNLILKIMK